MQYYITIHYPPCRENSIAKGLTIPGSNPPKTDTGDLDEALAVARHTSAYITRLLLMLALTAYPLLAVLFVPRLEGLRVGASYLLIAVGLAALWFSIEIYRSAIEPLPVPSFLLGGLVIAGGAAFDVYATLVHSPTLADEQNRIARILLDSGHSLPFVYVFAFVGQMLIIAIAWLLWGAYLRHRPTLVRLLTHFRPQSIWQFHKLAAGYSEHSWRQILFATKLRDLPDLYYPMWAYLAVPLTYTFLHRWWLGLEWFSLAPYLTWQPKLIPLFAGAVVTILWLNQVYRKSKNRT